MSTSTPWWYSGPSPRDDASTAPGASARDEDEDRTQPGWGRFDIAGLASGAQQLVELARQTLLAPHASHDEPREHPECMICRATAAFGEMRPEPDRASPGASIEWITLEPPQR